VKVVAVALLLTGCTLETPCPAPASIDMVITERQDSCDGVTVRQPLAATCVQNGYTREECSASQFYRCANGITMAIAVDSEALEGSMLVRDASGCESWYRLGPASGKGEP